MRTSAPFSEIRNKALQDPEFAAAYLEAYLVEDPGALNIALKHVADAYPGGLTIAYARCKIPRCWHIAPPARDNICQPDRRRLL